MIPSFRDILEVFQSHGVEFIMVGGVAAVIQGAPVTTFDLATLIKVDEENAMKPRMSIGLAGATVIALIAVATAVDFGFPPDQNIGRFDWKIGLAHNDTVEGELTLNLYTPLTTCNPFDEQTPDLQVQVDFSFTSVCVHSEVD